MGRAKEDQPESSSLEGCCCGPLFHKESRGISQVSQDDWLAVDVSHRASWYGHLKARRP